jgi:protein-S-isoprenylcysteine O-methyltransferase Ste14
VAYIFPVGNNSINFPEWLRYSGFIVLVLSMVLGIVALFQLNTKLSPFPTPVFNGKLLITGAYKIARHPIYSALIFSGFGYALFKVSWYKALITLLLLILFYFKSQYEEKLLSEKFSGYSDYQKKTRRFI